MSTPTSRSLNGITLEAILNNSWPIMAGSKWAKLIDINCFTTDPSIKSSLKFLRKTPWARARVEELYLGMPG